MADIEREIQNHYNLPTLYPSEWPSEKNLSSDEEDAAPPVQQKTLAPAPRERRKSRFYTLERTATNRVSIPGAERGKDGIENLVQKDEPDPLGSYPSVVQVLRQRGLPVEDDMKLRM
jgi:exocyst complex component 2